MAPKPLTLDTGPEGTAGPAGPGVAPESAPANVVVLAGDATLLEILKHSLEGRQRVWRADDVIHAADLLVAAQTGVLFIDAAVTEHDSPALVDKLHDQFPDLPIIVAGRRDDELALGQRISNGIVFRFLHKPVSADRVRNFVEAAIRRLGEQPVPAPRNAEFSALKAARSIRLPQLRFDPELARRLARRSVLPGLAALALWALVAVVQQRPWEHITLPSLPMPTVREGAEPVAPAASATQPDVSRLLGAAALARTRGHLAEPEGQSAIELYRAVLIRDPGNEEARRGLARTAEELLLRVEQSLLARDIPAAAAALDAARSADPSNSRLEFFSSQLQRERSQARGASATLPAQGATLADRDLVEQANRLLTLADARMKDGRLTGGPDSAEAYVLEARSLRPEDPGIQQALNALSGRMLLAASEALAVGDLPAATGWLDRTEALGVDGKAVARLRAEMASMRLATVQEDRSRLLALANQRIAQGRLLEPSTDSARHFVDLLRAADPAYEGLAETQSLLASALLDEAQALASSGRYSEADARIAAAESVGARAGDVTRTRSLVGASRALARAASEVLPENSLNRTVHQPVRYPSRARDRRIEGWVDVEFTVAADGTTRNPVVMESSPEGMFEEATLQAISGWQYEPRVVAGRPVDQRVMLRVSFQLSGG